VSVAYTTEISSDVDLTLTVRLKKQNKVEYLLLYYRDRENDLKKKTKTTLTEVVLVKKFFTAVRY